MAESTLQVACHSSSVLQGGQQKIIISIIQCGRQKASTAGQWQAAPETRQEQINNKQCIQQHAACCCLMQLPCSCYYDVSVFC
jgi:hypothetical protein